MMRKLFVVVAIVFLSSITMLTDQANAACSNSQPVQCPAAYCIQGLYDNDGNTSTAPPDLYIKAYGLGTGAELCTRNPDTPTDSCWGVEIVDSGAAGAWNNGDWGNLDVPGCEQDVLGDAYPSVTVFVLEQLNGTGTPQYLAYGVDRSSNNWYYMDGNNAACERSFSNLPKVSITGGTLSALDISWAASKYFNNTSCTGSTGGESQQFQRCGTASPGTPCNHLIAGYYLAYRFYDYDINTGSCPDPTTITGASLKISDTTGTYTWNVDTGTILASGCLDTGTGGNCTATVDLSTQKASCNTSTGAQCCLLLGVVHAYSLSSNNGTYFAGFYTGGSDQMIYLGSGSPLAGHIESFNGQLAQRTVVLTWKTALESGLKGFQIKRACDNSNKWVQINRGIIPARGVDNSTYRFKEERPGCRYAARYQIYTVLQDGSIEPYDKVVTIPFRSYNPKKSKQKALGRSVKPIKH